jgi:predicted nucleotidyltransferase
MNGASHLLRIMRAMREAGLEAILIGNAGAAMQGAPVTTDDFDFFYRLSSQSSKKIARFAGILGASARTPYYPTSAMIRVVGSRPRIQVDLLGVMHGVRSFEGLRARATGVTVGGERLLVASLADIIKSKQAAGRPKDMAVLPVLEATLREKSGLLQRSPRPKKDWR